MYVCESVTVICHLHLCLLCVKIEPQEWSQMTAGLLLNRSEATRRHCGIHVTSPQMQGPPAFLKSHQGVVTVRWRVRLPQETLINMADDLHEAPCTVFIVTLFPAE